MSQSGGRFDFDDGGIYLGAWEDGKAHGQGICTGPKGQGEYAGSWNYGFEVLGVYTWPNGNTYAGSWALGKRHNLGVETRGRWEYKGEWTHGFKGRYGVRCNTASRAKYEGTWNNGLQDGYGTETYADGGTYQGQWVGGMRQGSGIRQSAPYGVASVIRGSLRISMSSLRSEISNGTFSNSDTGMTDARAESRAGFVLSRTRSTSQQSGSTKSNRMLRSSSVSLRKSILNGLKIRSRSSASIASATSSKSCKSTMTTNSQFSNASDCNSLYSGPDMMSPLEPIVDQVAINTSETYFGEWKNDARTGYGVCKRSDGLMYEGEWLHNQRHGYGSTTFPDGTKEEGKYKDNMIITEHRKKNFSMKSGKIRTKVLHAVEQAKKAKAVAIQKSDITLSRTDHSVSKANQAETVAQNARDEAKIARCVARDQDPDFHQPGLEYVRQRGEDPFKEADAVDSYLEERERADVRGPESYHQYSNKTKESGLLTSPVPSRSGSVDANAMEGYEGNILSKQTNENSLSPMHGNVNSRNSASQAQNQAQTYKAKHMQFLSPESAVNLGSGATSTEKKSTSKALYKKKVLSASKASSLNFDPKSETSSMNSIDNTSPGVQEELTPRRKHSFFHSLRCRGKKQASGTDSGIASISSNSGKPGLSNQSDVNAEQAWKSETFEDKRKLFKKATSMPQHLNNSYNSRSVDLGSFDYENNQDRYLAGYETEMQENDLSTRVILQDHLLPSNHYNYAASQENLRHHNITSHDTPDQALASSGPSLYNKPMPPSLHHHSSHPGRLNNSAVGDSDGKHKIRYPRSALTHAQNNSLSVSALRPRATENSSEPVVLPPVPAFANYSVPISVQDFDSGQTTTLPDGGDHRGPARAKDQGTMFDLQDVSYEDNDAISGGLNSEQSRSPLPSNLRRRTKKRVTKSNDVAASNQESDSGMVHMIILVFLLIVGFLALYLQFLT